MLRLSVVMATYNRCVTLTKTLAHLANQDLPKDAYEVIVIDDASPDNTPEVVREIAKTMPYEVTFLRHEENRGAGYTQNRGIRVARAPLLLIMADDILMAPGALSAHLKTHEKHPERQVSVLGNVIKCPEMMEKSVFLKNFDPFRYEELWADLEELPFHIWGAANISLKTEFMRDCGMFTEHKGRAGAHCHDDVQVGYKLHGHGMRLLFDKDAWGYHHHFYTLDSAAKKWRERGLNWGEFRKYMPDPEYTVTSHLFNRRTFREFIGVLLGPNTLTGREKSLTWHLSRELVRRLVFNQMTIPLLWRPFLEGAESIPRLARVVRPPMYRAFLHYHWNRAVVEADTIYGQ